MAYLLIFYLKGIKALSLVLLVFRVTLPKSVSMYETSLFYFTSFPKKGCCHEIHTRSYITYILMDIRSF